MGGILREESIFFGGGGGGGFQSQTQPHTNFKHYIVQLQRHSHLFESHRTMGEPIERSNPLPKQVQEPAAHSKTTSIAQTLMIEEQIPHPQDNVPHVSGDTGAGDIFHGGDDVAEKKLTKFEEQGHESVQHHKHRTHMGQHPTDVEILKDEGADLPHHTHAGHVDLPGAQD